MRYDIELQQLRYVIAVAETGSFSRAAERLFVVQSNVSAQVRKVEQRLGVSLFERRAHDVVITEFASAFLPGARRTLAALEEAQAAVDAVRGLKLGSARLGLIGTVAAWLLPSVARRFRAEHPLVDLWVTEEPSATLEEAVVLRKLSQALVNLPTQHTEQLHSEALFHEELVLVVPPDHPKRGCEQAHLHDFRDDEWLLPEAGNSLRRMICDAFGSEQFMPVPRIEVGKKQLMQELVLAGVGVALLPAATALHYLGDESGRVIRLASPRLIRTVGFITHRGVERSPGDMALEQLVRAVFEEYAALSKRRGTGLEAPLLAASPESDQQERLEAIPITSAEGS